MKKIIVGVLLSLALMGAVRADLAITSFQGNGQVTWINNLNTNAYFRVEWASSPTGTWQRSFQSLSLIEAKSNTSFEASVPMFYRVVMTTNPPPSGMCFVERGWFQIGYPDYNPTGTNWNINISAFYMDRYLVTKTMWDQVRAWGLTNGYNDLSAGQAGSSGNSSSSNHPVTMVSWYDCVKWVNARSEKEGLTPCYYTNGTFAAVYRSGTNDIQSAWVRWDVNGYRLPTECEWEKAARGGLVSRTFPWGDTIDGSMANFVNSGDIYDNGTTPVGYYNGSQLPAGKDMANGYGLYDMAGNLWELCWDWRTNNPPIAGSVDPRGPDSGTVASRVARGGPWLNGRESQFARTACRGGFYVYQQVNGCGFRCVRSKE